MKSVNKKNQKKEGRPGATPEKKAPGQKRKDYPHETQLDLDKDDSVSSWSEDHDVIPPIPHVFPSFGNAETDFVSEGRHGRKTGRMVDHEPGI